MNRNDRLIPAAIEAIDKFFLNPDKSIQKEYKGYIASFGTSINQSGLVASISFFTDKGNAKIGTPEYMRNAFLKAILYILNKAETKSLLDYVLEKIYRNYDSEKFEYKFEIGNLDQKKLEMLEDKIITSTIALKLALRTYQLKK